MFDIFTFEPLLSIFTLAVTAHALSLFVVLSAASLVLVHALRIKLDRAKWADYPSHDEIPASSLRKVASKKALANLSGNVDVAVVGSGVGALASASMLAKAGYRVVVFEKHYVVGGSTQTFTHDGYEFDVGVHYIGGGHEITNMYDYLSDGKLKFTKMADAYDICYNAETEQRIEFTDNPDVNRKNLISTIGGGLDEEALDRYDAACLRARMACRFLIVLKLLPPFVLHLIWPLLATPVYQRFALKPAKTVMEECDLPPDAVGALTYHWGDIGTTPGRVPIFMHAVLDNHYKRGAYFPTGGSASIAKTLVAAITRRGGQVFALSPVQSILTEKTLLGGYRAVGVRVHGVDVMVRKCVISDAGFRNTFGTVCSKETDKVPLVDARASATQRALLYENGREVTELCTSYVSLYVGLDVTDLEIGIPAQNVWHLRNWNHDENFKRMMAAETYYEEGEDPPFLFISNESAKDPEYVKNHPGKGATLEVMAPANFLWFNEWRDETTKHRGSDYEAMKDLIGGSLLKALYMHFPQIKGHVVFTEVATPLTVDHYLGRQRGETYNLDHTVWRFNSLSAQRGLHPETTVKNLYLAGQDALCVSVVGSTISGVIAASRASFVALLHALPLLLPGIGIFV